MCMHLDTQAVNVLKSDQFGFEVSLEGVDCVAVPSINGRVVLQAERPSLDRIKL